MNFSALRRNLLVGSLGLALSAGLLGQAVAGEQLQKSRTPAKSRSAWKALIHRSVSLMKAAS